MDEREILDEFVRRRESKNSKLQMCNVERWVGRRRGKRRNGNQSICHRKQVDAVAKLGRRMENGAVGDIGIIIYGVFFFLLVL